MSSKELLGLPKVTPELKSVVPYLQRAEEVKTQEPIVAYWCAYYAAQIGIGLKARDASSREILIALLGVLERMKSEIGPNDAVDVDAAGSAYVENFALKLFALADNEDRASRATRATAKRFLAAANFLEVLRTFPKSDAADSTAEKIRYAKWKAADISKAFREGRKPAPGPPGFTEEHESAAAQDLQSLPPPSNAPLKSPSPPRTTFPRTSPSPSPPRLSSRAGKESPPLPPPTRPPGSFDSNPVWGISSSLDDNWSTIATPGTEPNTSGIIREDSFDRGRELGAAKHHRSNSGGGYNGKGSSNSVPRRGQWVSEELEGKRTPSPLTMPTKPRSPTRSGSNDSSPTRQGRNNSRGSDKKVHFTPSAAGGSTSSCSPRTSPHLRSQHLPSSNTPHQPFFNIPTAQDAKYGSNSPPLPPPSLPSASWSPPRRQGPMVPPPPPPPAPPVELTPAIIAKAQKHCRFAASALDYEDAETARKELRAALAMLGG